MKRKEIFIQARFDERITLSRRREPPNVESECESCGDRVSWMPVMSLLKEFELTPDDLISAVENGRLHLRLDRGGILYICERSAIARFRSIEAELNVKRKEA